MGPLVRIETFSRKPLIGRRQYYARIVSARNGKTLWRTSEGYNNRSDRDAAIEALGLSRVRIVEVER